MCAIHRSFALSHPYRCPTATSKIKNLPVIKKSFQDG